MSTPTNANCPRCGTALASNAPEGLCPRCLGALNLLEDTALTGVLPAPAQPPLTPAELAPHFPQLEIIECLGRGGMGVVYKARQKTLNRLVALKLLAPERVTDAGFAERFTREAQALARLSHPNIVTIHDFGRTTPPQTPDPIPHPPFFYLLMEFVDGVNLRQAMKAGRFTPEQALAVVPPVCEALQYAHDHGIVHRDIKPGNIMVLADGRIKIMDFGIARLREPTVKTQTGVLLGSPQYMSPEQISGQGLDGRADIFSLGVVLYEMLTGIKPFDAADLTQVLFWVVNMPTKPPSERRPGLPPVIDYILARALKKKPEERYATATEFAADLRESVAEVLAAEVTMRERAALEASSALPTIPFSGEAAGDEPTVPMAPERLELRASRRFDSAAGLARLSALPADGDGTQSRGGWTVPVVPVRKRIDAATAILLACYGAALLAAVAIVLV